MIASEPCRTGIDSIVFVSVSLTALLASISFSPASLGASSVPQNGNSLYFGASPSPKAFRHAPLPALPPVDSYVTVGVLRSP